MKKSLLFVFALFTSLIYSQSPNYSEDIASILYENCTECHNSGGIAPFSLMNYQEASSMAPQVVLSIISGQMPPWPADTNYQRYAHERILSTSEINKIIDWNNNGTPEGDPNLAPSPPTYVVGAKIPTPPDFTLELPTYTSTAFNEDDYICFTETTSFSTDKWVKAIEIVPGNLATVHHALVYIDTSNNNSSVTTDCMGVEGSLIAGYVPGTAPTIFPNGQNVKMGVKIPAGAKITVQMHYPLGSGGSVDSTKVNFFFYPDGTPNIRQVFNQAVLANWNLWIPPNTTPVFNAEYPPGNNTLSTDFSILSVFPHMHLIGQEITSYAVSPSNDTIPFERITHWDFEWQGYYHFRNLLKVPMGSKLYAEAKYNNTSSNPHNPFNPPQLITAGEATTDEMLLVFLQFVVYEQGDENLNLDDLLTVGEKEITNFKTFKISPNPVVNSFLIDMPLNNDLDYMILDMSGKLVKKAKLKGNQISVKELNSGQYLISIINDESIYSSKFIKE